MKDLLEGIFNGCSQRCCTQLVIKQKNGIVTYSITLASHNLVKYLGIRSLSATNIITLCQINGPENLGILYAINRDHFTKFQELKQYGGTDLPFYNMANAKALYTLILE